MLRLLLLFAFVLAAYANTEINNFGPVLCRTDEYGHLAAKAVEQLSQSWPVVGVQSAPSMFTIHAEKADDKQGSRKGAWVVLDVGQGTTLPHEGGSPRDLWLWKLFKRHTVRMSWSAHTPLDVALEIHSPESALQAGGVEWAAEKIAETTSSASAPGQTAPSNAYSIVPKETQPSLPAEPAATVTLERDARILASESVRMDAEPGQAPCDKVYLHLVATRNGVRVPSSEPHTWFGASSRIPPADGSQVPIHLTLEKLHMGFLPATSLQMVAIMLPVMVLGWFVLRPRVERLVTKAPARKSD